MGRSGAEAAAAALGTAGRRVRAACPWLPGLAWVLVPQPSLKHYERAPVCVWGEGTKRRVREGGWGDETGVQPRHPDRLQSPRGRGGGGGEEKARCGRRRTASRPARGLRRICKGRSVERRPCLGKGTGLLLELVGNLRTGDSRDSMSCRCCFKLFALKKLKNKRPF